MATKAQIKAQEQLLELLNSSNQVISKSSELLFDQIEASTRLSSKQKDQVKTLNMINDTEKGNLHINDKLNVLKSRAKEVTDKTLDSEIKRLKVQKAGTDAVKEQSEALLKGLTKSISMIERLPAGGMLIQAMGLGPKNLKNLQDNLAEVITGARPMAKIFEGMPKNMGSMVKKGLMLGAAIGVVGGLFSLFKKSVTFVAGMIDELGASFGVVGTQSGDFKNTMMDASVEVVSIGKATKDVIEVTQELSQNFGLSFNEAAKFSDKILDSAVGMGMSNSEAAKLFGTFISLGGLSLEQAENLAESTFQLAAQNGVAPVAVMRDISESSSLIAKFGAENLKSITNAAIQARKMGLNLSTVEKISDSLLDFQSSIQAEMEASVMIGRKINLNEARRLNFAGDTEGAFKAVVKQMGSIDKFEKLGVLQRRALAKAVGMEETELAKLVRNQGKQIEQQKTFNDIMGEDGLSALTSLINKVTELGRTFLMEFGVPLENFIKRIENTLLDEKKMAKLKKNITGVADTAKQTIKTGAGLAGAYAGGKLGATIGSFIAPGIGTAIGGAIGAGLGGLAAFFTTGSALTPDTPVNDFKSSGGSHLVITPSGQALRTNPRDTVFGTTSVNDFMSGPAGSMSLNNKELINEIRLLREEMTANTSEAKRTTNAVASLAT